MLDKTILFNTLEKFFLKVYDKKISENFFQLRKES